MHPGKRSHFWLASLVTWNRVRRNLTCQIWGQIWPKKITKDVWRKSCRVIVSCCWNIQAKFDCLRWSVICGILLAIIVCFVFDFFIMEDCYWYYVKFSCFLVQIHNYDLWCYVMFPVCLYKSLLKTFHIILGFQVLFYMSMLLVMILWLYFLFPDESSYWRRIAISLHKYDPNCVNEMYILGFWIYIN